eukprot:GFYU01001800.1.p1 GENE.GFYU01001800.1~~GFYU01001800.1.p1  ORF type:complete len:288 (-),score=42.34 GFYU01001800.1:172-951(-)
MEQVNLHHSEDDFWIVVHGKVYDVTKFLDEHPGGVDTILDGHGDRTADYEDAMHSDAAFKQMQEYYIGDLVKPGQKPTYDPKKAAKTSPPTNQMSSVSINTSGKESTASASLSVPGASSSLSVPGAKAGGALQVPGGGDTIMPKGRGKVNMGHGRSQLDWIRTQQKAVDLAGTGGKMMRITPKQLARANRRDAAWTVIRGKVYNITPYLEFHPGGTDELMRCAGKDGTKLFDEIHPWVTVEAILGKCLVGTMVPDDGKE